ncbi:PH domain-containing protein [uncultured Aeromicrobium sp.]|uniref:PH domain-containing protein n=1 Tax=uncultured Aeromicrobium sp. TaxID=337820 RepID=UPI0025D29059|nr:PH domain-containing protein [uncultured Aeromicrobium sp.]
MSDSHDAAGVPLEPAATPGTPPVPAGSQSEGRRTHPMTALVQGGLWAAGGAIGLFNAFFSDEGFGVVRALLGLAAAVGGGLLIGLLAGYLRWRFTRYFIDGTEARIESGVLFRTSRRIPYERLQSVDIDEPFIARLFGLAELHMEMAGGSESRTTLRFLTLAEARQLRRVLLSRAHGAQWHEGATIPEEQRTVIAVVTPDRIIVGTLLSLDFLISAGTVVLLLVTGFVIPGAWALFGGIIPAGFWVVQIVGTRVIAQWNFTLSRGTRGLRIERGLLSRSSQTIPFERVQGIAVIEPFLWRKIGWQRLAVDVAGYGASAEEESGVSDTTLLPIADPQLARSVAEQLVPQSDPSGVDPIRASPRSWVFAPIGWRFRWVGATERTFLAQEGWIQRTTDLVPHHKTQSVALRQGPLQRWRGVATVEVHTPPGPVDADGRHLDGPTARAVALDQLNRSRAVDAPFVATAPPEDAPEIEGPDSPRVPD